jgi:hypothetical protein
MKIFNVSYKNSDIWDEIHLISGRPYGFLGGIRRGGTGTPRGILEDAPEDVLNKYKNVQSIPYCGFREMKEGLLLYFRIRNEVFTIPMNKKDITNLNWNKKEGPRSFLSLATKSGESFSISYPKQYTPSMDKFIRKIRS